MGGEGKKKGRKKKKKKAFIASYYSGHRVSRHRRLALGQGREKEEKKGTI